jgi:hypothetical protein
MAIEEGAMHTRWAAFYGPKTIRAMITAFDEAWRFVEFDVDASQQSIEAVRLRLADNILAAAARDDRSVRTLRDAGLLATAMQYRLCPDNFVTTRTIPQRTYNSTYWLSYAKETLSIAGHIKDDPEGKRLLMGVAETYAELARRANAREKQPSDKAATHA